MTKNFRSVLLAVFVFTAALSLRALAQDDDHDQDYLTNKEIQEALVKFGDGTNALGQGMADGIASDIARFGHPKGVIVGGEFEVSALFLGYRKGSGHVVFKGQDLSKAPKIFWEAPSLGIGVGLASSRSCLLIYGTENYQELMGEYGSGSGSAHWIAGASISYLAQAGQQEHVHIADVGVGIGFNLTAHVEALKLTPKEHWLP